MTSVSDLERHQHFPVCSFTSFLWTDWGIICHAAAKMTPFLFREGHCHFPIRSFTISPWTGWGIIGHAPARVTPFVVLEMYHHLPVCSLMVFSWTPPSPSPYQFFSITLPLTVPCFSNGRGPSGYIIFRLVDLHSAYPGRLHHLSNGSERFHYSPTSSSGS